MSQMPFGLDYPLVQAPMASVQGSALAAAVCSVGALGSLPCAVLDNNAIQRELTALSQQTRKPFNVNFFCHREPVVEPAAEAHWREVLGPYFRELEINPGDIPAGPLRKPFSTEAADVVEAFRPAVMSFHFGLPSADLLARVRSWGSKIVASATTVEEARWLEARGVDAIIAQGVEAGGHRGMFLSDEVTTQVGTFALLPQIVRAVRVPVIAAGGIADARGVKAALALGASAVQVGTAFLLCPEVTTSALHRAALKSESSRHTALSNLFTGRPARAIVNRVIRELGPLNQAAPAFPLAAGAMGVLRARAEKRGISDFSALWCGQNSSGCQDISAAEKTRQLLG
jgi:nitronate monooxygenase